MRLPTASPCTSVFNIALYFHLRKFALSTFGGSCAGLGTEAMPGRLEGWITNKHWSMGSFGTRTTKHHDCHIRHHIFMITVVISSKQSNHLEILNWIIFQLQGTGGCADVCTLWTTLSARASNGRSLCSPQLPPPS